MNKKLVIIGFTLAFLIGGLSGCTDDEEEELTIQDLLIKQLQYDDKNISIKGYIGYTIDNSTIPDELIEIPQLLDATKNYSIGLDNFSYNSLTLEENTHIEVSGEFSMGYWSEFGSYVLPKIWVEEVRILK